MLIQGWALSSLSGLTLLTSLPGALLGIRYLDGAADSSGRDRGHNLTIVAIIVCVLAIPIGIGLIAYWIGRIAVQRRNSARIQIHIPIDAIPEPADMPRINPSIGVMPRCAA